MQPSAPQSIALLGSTGSIGTQVIETVLQYPQRFQIKTLACGQNVSKLAEQMRQLAPEHVCVSTQNARQALQEILAARKIPFHGEILVGEAGLNTLAQAEHCNTVVMGVVGMTGLAPTLAALKAGKRVLTANKESIVCGGHLLQPWLAQLIPFDSEHSAVFQCLPNFGHTSGLAGNYCQPDRQISKIFLTASGGPFRTYDRQALQRVTPEQALKHPNWEMGAKITIDSATMMNKGLEVIEAHWLFGLPYEQIEILVHPQSIVHGGVAYADGSQIFQLGAADMRVPILIALGYPERLSGEGLVHTLDWQDIAKLEFAPPDLDRFPCLKLGYEAGRLGSDVATVLNQANDMLVEAFIQGHIGFMDIPDLLARIIDDFISHHPRQPAPSLEEIFALVQWSQEKTTFWLKHSPVSV